MKGNRNSKTAESTDYKFNFEDLKDDKNSLVDGLRKIDASYYKKGDSAADKPIPVDKLIEYAGMAKQVPLADIQELIIKTEKDKASSTAQKLDCTVEELAARAYEVLNSFVQDVTREPRIQIVTSQGKSKDLCEACGINVTEDQSKGPQIISKVFEGLAKEGLSSSQIIHVLDLSQATAGSGVSVPVVMHAMTASETSMPDYTRQVEASKSINIDKDKNVTLQYKASLVGSDNNENHKDQIDSITTIKLDRNNIEPKISVQVKAHGEKAQKICETLFKDASEKRDIKEFIQNKVQPGLEQRKGKKMTKSEFHQFAATFEKDLQSIMSDKSPKFIKEATKHIIRTVDLDKDKMVPKKGLLNFGLHAKQAKFTGDSKKFVTQAIEEFKQNQQHNSTNQTPVSKFNNNKQLLSK